MPSTRYTLPARRRPSSSASGLGLATARRLVEGGAKVVLLDLEGSAGADVAADLGGGTRFVAGDVRTEEGVTPALDRAEELGPLRAVVHCAGRGHAMRVLQRDGSPGSPKYTDSAVAPMKHHFHSISLCKPLPFHDSRILFCCFRS